MESNTFTADEGKQNTHGKICKYIYFLFQHNKKYIYFIVFTNFYGYYTIVRNYFYCFLW